MQTQNYSYLPFTVTQANNGFETSEGCYQIQTWSIFNPSALTSWLLVSFLPRIITSLLNTTLSPSHFSCISCWVFFHLSLSRELGMALWEIRAKIIPCSTDFANWSCHWALQMVLSQQKSMWQEAPSNLHNPGFQLWVTVATFVVLEAHKQPRRDVITYAQYQLRWPNVW